MPVLAEIVSGLTRTLEYDVWYFHQLLVVPV